MVKDRYEVVKINKRTGEEEVVLSTLSVAECENVAKKRNSDLTPEQRQETEYRCRGGGRAYRFRIGK
jgi:hypothetical protein